MTKKILFTLLFCLIAVTGHCAATGSWIGTHSSGDWSTTTLNISTSHTDLNCTELFADIGDVEPFSNPSGSIFQVNGNRELQIYSGDYLTVATGETLQWNLTAHKYPILDVRSGSHFTMQAGATLIGDVNDTYYSYIYFYGHVELNGTEGSHVTLTQYRSIYHYGATVELNYDYADFTNSTYSSGYYWYFRPGSRSSSQLQGSAGVGININNCTVSDTGHYGDMYFDEGDYSLFTFTDIEFNNIDDVTMYGGTNLKFTRLTVTSLLDYSTPYNFGGTSQMTAYNTSKTKVQGLGSRNQPYLIYEDCTFDASSDAYAFGIAYAGSAVLFKDCTFTNDTYGAYAYGGSVILWYGDNTFTSISSADRVWGGNGTHLHVRELNITVQDSDSVAIPNATVTVRTKLEKSGLPYESWSFLTDANGQVVNNTGDGIFLTEKEEVSTGSYVQWSDGTSNNVHIIEVGKTGYTMDTREIAMTQDRTVVVTLTANDATTKLIDSTIYDSTIY